MEEIIVNVKAEKVIDISSEYLVELERNYLATTEELSKDEYVNIKFNGDDVYASDSQIIPIVELKKLIEKVENAGANFIAIDFHTDHLEYDILGYRISRMTDNEVQVVKQMKLLEKEKSKLFKIQELENQIALLKSVK